MYFTVNIFIITSLMSFFYMIVLYSIHSSWKNQIKFLIEPEEYDEQN